MWKPPGLERLAGLLRRELPASRKLAGFAPGGGAGMGLDPGRREDHDEADEKQQECRRSHPFRQGERLLQGLGDLHDDPRSPQIDDEDLEESGVADSIPEVVRWHGDKLSGGVPAATSIENMLHWLRRFPIRLTGGTDANANPRDRGPRGGDGGGLSPRMEERLAGGGSGLTKKEQLQLDRERERLEASLGGIREMGGLPDLMFVIDVKKEAIAIQEARSLAFL